MPKLVVLLTFLIFGDNLLADKQELGIGKGKFAPNFSAKTVDGNQIDLTSTLEKGPAVIVFYRGGWCPYCNIELKKIEQKIFPAVEKVKGTIIAISVDRPQEGLKTASKNKLSFPIISDPDLTIHKQYNVLNKLDTAGVERLKGFGIDIVKASGRKHHTIAVPATFVLSKSGKIIYEFYDRNYKKRAPTEEVLKALANPIL